MYSNVCSRTRLQVVGSGNLKSFMYRNSFANTLKDEMIGNEVKKNFLPLLSKIKRIVMTGQEQIYFK